MARIIVVVVPVPATVIVAGSASPATATAVSEARSPDVAACTGFAACESVTAYGRSRHDTAKGCGRQARSGTPARGRRQRRAAMRRFLSSSSLPSWMPSEVRELGDVDRRAISVQWRADHHVRAVAGHRQREPGQERCTHFRSLPQPMPPALPNGLGQHLPRHAWPRPFAGRDARPASRIAGQHSVGSANPLLRRERWRRGHRIECDGPERRDEGLNLAGGFARCVLGWQAWRLGDQPAPANPRTRRRARRHGDENQS